MALYNGFNWVRTARDHEQFHEDMKVSIDNNFARGVAPFAFMPRLALAPFFRWSMVMCDYMHATTLFPTRGQNPAKYNIFKPLQYIVIRRY